jgi:hypothetical protein
MPFPLSLGPILPKGVYSTAGINVGIIRGGGARDVVFRSFPRIYPRTESFSLNLLSLPSSSQGDIQEILRRCIPRREEEEERKRVWRVS